MSRSAAEPVAVRPALAQARGTQVARLVVGVASGTLVAEMLLGLWLAALDPPAGLDEVHTVVSSVLAVSAVVVLVAATLGLALDRATHSVRRSIALAVFTLMGACFGALVLVVLGAPFFGGQGARPWALHGAVAGGVISLCGFASAEMIGDRPTLSYGIGAGFFVCVVASGVLG